MGEKKHNKAFRGLYFWEYTKKTLKWNLVLVVVLVLQSEGLCCFSVVTMLLQVSHQSEMRYYTPLLNDPPINNTNKEVYNTFLSITVPSMYSTEIFKTFMKYFLKHYGAQSFFQFKTGNLSP